MPYSGFGTTTSLSQAEIAAIELAVKVTGQQAVTDLEAALGHTKQTIDQFKGALAANVITATEFVERTKAVVAEETRLADSVKAANNAMAGTSNRFSNTGQAALQLSYALDDLQYGFSSIVNNAPQIALAMGGGPGLAGAMGVAFVAANVLGKYLPDLGSYFTQFARDIKLIDDPVRSAASNLEGMQAVVQALTDKPFKVEVEYATIRTLTRDIEKATRAITEFDTLNKQRTEAQQASHKAVAEGVVESGGGAHKLEDALIEIAKREGTYGAGSETQGQIDLYQGIAEKSAEIIGRFGATSALGQPAMVAMRAALAKVEELRDQMDREQREKIAETIGLKHGEGSRKTLEDIVTGEANADVFARHGIDTQRLQAGLGMASAADQKEVAQRKLRLEREKKEAEDAEEETRDRTERNRDAAALRKQNAAKEQAEGVWQIQQQQRLNHEKEVADNKALAERKKRVDKIAPSFTARAAALIGENELLATAGAPVARSRRQEQQFAAMGQPYSLPPEVLERRIDTRIGRDLRASGQDPGLAPDIRKKGADTFFGKLTEAQGRTPLPDATALADAVGGHNAAAAANQAQATAAILDVLRGLQAKAVQIQGVTEKNAQQAMGLQGDAKQNRVRKPHLQMPFSTLN